MSANSQKERILNVEEKRELINLIQDYGKASDELGSLNARKHPDCIKAMEKTIASFNEILNFIYSNEIKLDKGQANGN